MASHNQQSPNVGIEHRRTVHGGANSALSVEVSAWRIEADQPLNQPDRPDYVAGCNHELPERWHGVGVYIRNPLAFHVEDFWIGPIGTKAPGGKDVWGSPEQAKFAAFKYADALAEHLGCSVKSQLQR